MARVSLSPPRFFLVDAIVAHRIGGAQAPYGSVVTIGMSPETIPMNHHAMSAENASTISVDTGLSRTVSAISLILVPLRSAIDFGEFC